MPDKKIDEKDLEKISGGTGSVFNETTGGGGSGSAPSGNDPVAIPGNPTGGSPGVKKETPAGGLGGGSNPSDLTNT